MTFSPNMELYQIKETCEHLIYRLCLLERIIDPVVDSTKQAVLMSIPGAVMKGFKSYLLQILWHILSEHVRITTIMHSYIIFI